MSNIRDTSNDWIIDLGIMCVLASFLIQLFQSADFIAGFEYYDYQFASLSMTFFGLLFILIGWVRLRYSSYKQRIQENAT